MRNKTVISSRKKKSQKNSISPNKIIILFKRYCIPRLECKLTIEVSSSIVLFFNEIKRLIKV